MKIIISRTSDWDSPSCPEAKKETLILTRLDRRNVKTLKEVKNYSWGEGWFDKGVNHREENGMVVRDMIETQSVWTIEVNIIDDFMELCKKYGDLIFMSTNFKEIKYEIEIYDDYRE